MRAALFPLLISLLPTTASTVALADGFLGAWARGDGIARVKVERCGAQICMTDTYIRPDVTSEKVGDKVIFDVKPQADGTLSGSAYDPQRDLKFSVVVTFAGDRMTTKGCVLAVVCKSESWTRIR